MDMKIKLPLDGYLRRLRKLLKRKAAGDKDAPISTEDVRAAEQVAYEANQLAFWLEKHRIRQGCPGLTRCRFDVEWTYDDEGAYFADVRAFTLFRLDIKGKEVSLGIDDPDGGSLLEENEPDELIAFSRLTDEELTNLRQLMGTEDEAMNEVEELVRKSADYESLRDLISTAIGMDSSTNEIIFGT